MVRRVYVKKKLPYQTEAKILLGTINDFLKINSVTAVDIFMRYDVEGVGEEVFLRTVNEILTDKLLDDVSCSPPVGDRVFAVEAVPGQYDQSADSAAVCISLINEGISPLVSTAEVYVLTGDISEIEFETIKKYLINSVERRQTSLEETNTLVKEYDEPKDIITLDTFIDLDTKGLIDFLNRYSLAMDIDDLTITQEYFKSIKRNPTITEIRVLDTYWSDHCRHTTFNTEIDEIVFENDIVKESYERYLLLKKQLGRNDRPVTLMDIASSAMRYLKSKGMLQNLDESKEVNACCVRTKVLVDENQEDWLLYFKNETHNHPTEIEPFGGAATCVGGAIRDPMSGRSYVYQGMRITGAGDVTAPFEETLDGKLPQRYITTTAAAGNSSYSNAAGLTAGYLDEIYHPGYTAKRMELGALVGAAKAENVVRREPVKGDIVVLLGDRTGRDGIGGATGSSRTQSSDAFEVNSAEVQKGNAVIGRSIMRLFRNPELSKLIIRCNDFGAGGVSVAIGELADGLVIDLDSVVPKYGGLDGTELAISESQERMAVVISEDSYARFKEIAESENLAVSIVARVSEEAKMVMNWRGKKIVDIDRAFLDLNGAIKRASAAVKEYELLDQSEKIDFTKGFMDIASNLSSASKKAIGTRFDSTVNAATLLLPFGGKYQATPIQCMAARFPVQNGITSTASVMAYGYNPYVSSKNQYMGAYLAVNESISKLIASGAKGEDIYLSFQEFFESLGNDEYRWGKPLSSLLGALDAQLDYSVASIGGKDSMSGSYEGIDVPPTLVSFAVTVTDEKNLISPEFKRIDSRVALLVPEYDKNTSLPTKESQLALWDNITSLIREKKILSAYAVGYKGVAEAIFRMSQGNRIGLNFENSFEPSLLFAPSYGSFVVELSDDTPIGISIGVTTLEYLLRNADTILSIAELESINEAILGDVFKSYYTVEDEDIRSIEVVRSTSAVTKETPYIHSSLGRSCPKALIPVFPGTNGEYDLANAARRAGIETEFFVMKNLTQHAVIESFSAFSKGLAGKNMLLLPSGISMGAQPDGAAKIITLFLNNPKVRYAVERLLESDGLIYGVGEGFKALIKTGLLPYGSYKDNNSITLTKNKGGYYVSMMTNVKVVSNRSIWMSEYSIDEIDILPFSTAEGRLVVEKDYLAELLLNGQITSVFTDFDGIASFEYSFNPGGSTGAVEGLTSPDGRVFGRICNSERNAKNLYLNIEKHTNKSIFDSAVKYFS